MHRTLSLPCRWQGIAEAARQDDVVLERSAPGLPKLGHHGVQRIASHADTAPVDGADEGQRRPEPQR
jgi:hypothetical protein